MMIEIKHKTPAGTHHICIEVKQISITDILAVIDEDHIKNLCEKGCENFNKKWCCPPFSPKISALLKDYSEATVIVMQMNLASFQNVKNPYLRVRAGNVILKSKCEKLARHLEDYLEGYALLSGSCNLCKPCKKKLEEKCAKPEKMRFSLESTGINVQKLLENVCQSQLEWYHKGKDPTQTSVVSMVLSNANDSDEQITYELKRMIDTSFSY